MTGARLNGAAVAMAGAHDLLTGTEVPGAPALSEAALLRACFLDNEAAQAILARTSRSHQTHHLRRRLHDALRASTDGGTPDVVRVTEELRQRGVSDAVGLVAGLVSSDLPVREWERHLRLVTSAADRRDAASVLVNAPCTELGFAERIHAVHGADMRFHAAERKWLVYSEDRGLWETDTDGAALRRAGDTARALSRAAADIDNKDRRDELLKFAQRSESHRALTAALHLTASRSGVTVGPTNSTRTRGCSRLRMVCWTFGPGSCGRISART